MKILYILCRYYPFFVWILISWAYVGNHSWDVCSRVVHPVHALLAPCVSVFFPAETRDRFLDTIRYSNLFHRVRRIIATASMPFDLTITFIAVMVMRAYAFAGRKLSVKILLGTCYAALLALDIWVFCGPLETLPQLFYIFVRGSGCFPNYGGSFMAAKIGVCFGLFGGVFTMLTELYAVFHCKYSTSFPGPELTLGSSPRR